MPMIASSPNAASSTTAISTTTHIMRTVAPSADRVKAGAVPVRDYPSTFGRCRSTIAEQSTPVGSVP